MKVWIATAVIALMLTGNAAAQLGPRIPPERQLPPIAIPAPAPTPAVSTITGCLARQLWDVQDIDNYTAQIWLTVSGRTERFNFQPNRVEMIAPTGAPLTTREQATRYDMIIRSIEAAGMARRQITVQYENASRKVFGIIVEWGLPACP
jgi:hypothetical protein